jgi:hypothetical protein
LNISAFSAQRYTEYIEKNLSKFLPYFKTE